MPDLTLIFDLPVDESQRRAHRRTTKGHKADRLDADPEAVCEALERDPLMRPLVAAAPGRRVPGCADPDEIAIRAVFGQQVSLACAATLAGLLVASYGQPLANPIGAVTHVFPTADAIAGAADEAMAMPAS